MPRPGQRKEPAPKRVTGSACLDGAQRPADQRVTLPALRQEVHTLRRFGVDPTIARTRWMFGFQRRLVRRCECEMLCPKLGFLPQTSQVEATVISWCWSGECHPADVRAHGHPSGNLHSVPDALRCAKIARGTSPISGRQPIITIGRGDLTDHDAIAVIPARDLLLGFLMRAEACQL